VYRATRRRRARARVVRWVAWLGVLVIVTAVMFVLRPQLDKAHVALGFLIVVLGGSAAGARSASRSRCCRSFCSTTCS
jgi:drug/metabolite transporter (DMT)-like permease